MDRAKRAEYVERWARANEGSGQSRISGRIYAHLATAEEPFLSLQELAEQLGVSRASVSTNTRQLIETGILKKVPVPGSRNDHYALDVEGARALLENSAKLARALEGLAREGLALQSDVVSPGTQSLRVMADTYATVADSLERAAAPKTRRAVKRASQ